MYVPYSIFRYMMKKKEEKTLTNFFLLLMCWRSMYFWILMTTESLLYPFSQIGYIFVNHSVFMEVIKLLIKYEQCAEPTRKEAHLSTHRVANLSITPTSASSIFAS